MPLAKKEVQNKSKLTEHSLEFLPMCGIGESSHYKLLQQSVISSSYLQRKQL